MWYEVGQALLWIGIVAIAIILFLKPIAYFIGRLRIHFAKKQQQATQAYHQGIEEEQQQWKNSSKSTQKDA